MGLLPSMVIVTRHGSRLDAADKDWHLKSSAPYDPPLTYGGWKQSHALGARIANIIHDRGRPRVKEQNTSANVTNGEPTHSAHLSHETTTKTSRKKGHPKRHRLVIHSSPYLRCLQTSVAIGAGIAEKQGDLPRPSSRGRHNPVPHDLHSGSPQIQGLHGPPLASIFEPALSDSEGPVGRDELLVKPILRVDAVLGEWLSLDYFKDITPPPDSKLLVAAAKAEMTIEGDYVAANLTKDTGPSNQVNQKGLWGGPTAGINSFRQDDRESPAKASAPRITRSNTHSLVGDSAMRPGATPMPRPDLAEIVSDRIYKQPIPSYVVSPSDPIPQGYVLFARDRCIDFDSKWDSTKPPQNWGDGGQLGESWTEMHTRLRKGLRNMLCWYQESELGAHGMLPEPAHALEVNEDEVDTILVIVTHSAACNALINALSNQPVLLDMATASLSLAVKKAPEVKPLYPAESPLSTRSQSIVDNTPFDEYHVKFIASTDHLKGKSMSQSRTRTSRGSMSSPHSGWRSILSISAASARSQAGHESDDESPTGNDLPSSMGNLDLNDNDNSSSPKSKPGLWTKPTAPQSPGLWKPSTKASSKLRQVSDGALISENDNDNEKRNLLGKTAESDIVSSPVSENLHHQNSVSKPPGLWGQLPDRSIDDPKKTLKRRWTHSAPQR